MDELTHLRQEMEATEPEAHEHDWGEWDAEYHGGHLVWRRCATCKATQSRTEGHYCPEHPEPEAPECKYPGGCPLEAGLCPPDKGCAFDAQLKGIAMMPRPEALPPRRPPYAVAYELQDGTQYEIALPGDATIRAHEGALIITHASAVTALTQARPMETE